MSALRPSVRALRLAAVAVATGCIVAGVPVALASASSDRVDLRVLLVSDGTSNVEAIRTELAAEGVPVTVVDIRSGATHTPITAGYLSDTVSTGPRAKFQSVVLPSDAPGGLTRDELTSLASYEARFGIRQVDSYVYPSPSVGLNYPSSSGSYDGRPASVTSAGLSGPFRYLSGSFSVDDYDASVGETYGYATTPAAGATFTSFVTVDGSPLVGAYTDGAGRQVMPITASFNGDQTYFRLMAHGLVTWMTKGVHLGYDRNYFAVQADDLFLPDSRWSTDGNCTPGDDCPSGVAPTSDIRMTSGDVSALVNWQKKNAFTIDLAFNAAGSDDAIASNGSDPLTNAVLANKGTLKLLNHTYSHQFLGCLQDFSVLPWRCQTDASGATQYLSQADISSEISSNLSWASQHGVALTAGDLVTGEHSGLRTLPQQPDDNPNLAPALSANRITSLASDASRENDQRAVGSALTIPRHPMNVFYNVATSAEEVDEYNWLYTSAAQGGSGNCSNAGSTCLASPLSTTTGYSSYIVPLEARIALSHVLANDPRPHYVHQSNLAEGRIAYPVLQRILSTYRGWFAASAPIVDLRLGQQGAVLTSASTWTATQAAGTVTAYTLSGQLHVESSTPGNTSVPVTAPASTSFGAAYAGEKSAYATVSPTKPLVVAVTAA